MGEDLKGEGSGAVLKLGMEGGRDAVLISLAEVPRGGCSHL